MNVQTGPLTPLVAVAPRRTLDLAKDTGALLRTMRHELRTPVNHIIGYGEMLIEESEGTLLAAQAGLLNRVVAAGKALLAQINECLSEAEAAREIDLDRIRERTDPPIDMVVALAGELERALAASPEGERFLPDVLRVAQAARNLRALVAGDVPALSYDDPPGEVLRPDEGGETYGRLLVVDDIPMNRDMLARRLERLGYQVLQAENGRVALDLLRQESVDLVLLDIMMPELDGYQVLGIMKEDADLGHIPVIVLSAIDHMESVIRCIEMGAEDYLPKPFDPVLLRARIGACLAKKRIHDMQQVYLEQIEAEKQRTNNLLHVVIPIGVALTTERDFNQLLERILQEAKDFCNADGGTLYLRTEDEKLRFVIVRNRVLNIAMGGVSGKDIPFAPLPLFDEDGQPIERYVVTQVAHTGATINIPDAYNAEGYDFSGTRAFDQRTGYRSTSMLTIPLKDAHGRVIGVLQLINARDGRTGEIAAFDANLQQMIESLSALATAALAAYAREQQLRKEIDDLRIEIDQSKKQREVERITQSAYFSHLQEKARELRGAAAGAERERPNELRRRIYVVDEQPVHVREQGLSSRQLLLMIHGWSSSWYALSPLMGTFSDRYRCVAVDLPGYGESPAFKGRPTTIPAYADLLASLIKQLSPDQPAILLGHSMGGMISLTLALRHPEVAERLVLLCPTISGHLSFWINTFISPITMLERFPITNLIVSRLERYVTSVTDRLMRPASFAERTGITEADYQKLRADARRPGQGRVRAECYWAMRQGDLRGRLKGLSVPSMVIWGMEDNTVPLRDASVVADEWPEAELRVIPKAGHWPQFETPDLTRRYVRAFLSTPLKLLKAQLGVGRGDLTRVRA